MLLSEQIRMIRDEESLVYDTALYAMTANTWTTLATKNISLSAARIVYVAFRGSPGSGAGSADVFQLRVLLDGVRIVSSGAIVGSTAVDREVYLCLEAGSYSFAFQGAQTAGTVLGRLTNIRVAALNFPDKQRNYYDSGTVSCPSGQTTIVLSDQQFTPPATRKLAVGQVKKYVCIITVYAGAAYRKSRLKNPGEANDSGFFNWKIYLDGVQQTWTERQEDWGGTDNNYANGSTGAYGRLVALAYPSTARILRIDVYNAFGSTQNCSARVDIIICPWFLADVDYEPVSLDFSQGSTLYVILEPLGIQYNNPTKYARVGKQRFVSFGDATDYYKTVSGTGILSFDYTFETVEVVNSLLHVKGLGGCVSTIGVDVR